MAALLRFLPEVVTWEGTIHEGGMGPGTPAMRGVGRGPSKLLQDGRWIAGDYEQDQLLTDGTFVLTWQLHWVVGWAPQRGEYRAAPLETAVVSHREQEEDPFTSIVAIIFVPNYTVLTCPPSSVGRAHP